MSNAAYMKQRRLQRRAALIELLGGKCSCGCKETTNLDFDHIKRETKKFRISGKDLDKPWQELVLETRKCQLLCKKSHRTKTAIEILAKHGTISRYFHRKLPCRCASCRTAFRSWKRDLYWRKHIAM